MSDLHQDPESGWRALNRAMWDRKAKEHVASPLYDVPGFLAGGSTLRGHELSDLGDVAGKDLVHLQCHIGLDSLSWARRGAIVTGLDFSAASVAAAREIAAQAGLNAAFEVGDVYDAPAVLGRRFDIVYTGVGALCWLPDLAPWAAAVAALLRPGGELYLFEFHPVEWILDQIDGQTLSIAFDYFTPSEGHLEAGAVAYASAASEDLAVPTVQWNHALGEVVTSLVCAGLAVEELRELDATVLEKWRGMTPTGDGMFRMSGGPNLPLMYVLRARQPFP